MLLVSANLKISLTAEGVDETILTQQRQLLSKVTIVLKKLQGQMTDAEVDTNVKAMYAICHQNVMQCIAERGLQGVLHRQPARGVLALPVLRAAWASCLRPVTTVTLAFSMVER